jgi:hypothetical protein
MKVNQTLRAQTHVRLPSEHPSAGRHVVRHVRNQVAEHHTACCYGWPIGEARMLVAEVDLSQRHTVDSVVYNSHLYPVSPLVMGAHTVDAMHPPAPRDLD